MTKGPRTLGILALCACVAAAACGDDAGRDDGEGTPVPGNPPEQEDLTPVVILETSKGAITLELDRAAAPVTVENFLAYVEDGFYDGLTFHRVIPGFMIQGGGYTPELRQRQPTREPITNEADNGLRNQRGKVAMARTSEPHSASAQFFINLVDNPSLDHTDKTARGWGYAVFGEVTDGMDVVEAIAGVSTEAQPPHQNVPVEPVLIERAYVADDRSSAG